jgi:predicted transcriptional regulator
MIREKILTRLQKEAEGSRIIPLAKRIGINYVSLWRIVKGKTKGSSDNWDRIFHYYGK